MTHNKYDGKYRLILLSAAAFLFCTSILLAWFYRPFIYRNDIFDFHFADNILNLFFIPVATLFSRGVSRKSSYNEAFIGSTFGLIFFRLLDALFVLPDIYTIVAVFLGVLITFGIGKLFKIK